VTDIIYLLISHQLKNAAYLSYMQFELGKCSILY
jgi:hypothetical protein